MIFLPIRIKNKAEMTDIYTDDGDTPENNKRSIVVGTQNKRCRIIPKINKTNSVYTNGNLKNHEIK